ncbi:PucR family transcriptional regulator [Streptomyces sp. Isolate_45]|uniref:PucR family transcriptional regulator n=1 Tax=Streptomyces sp. Isolate_45 TaxID=2950111 RepID=UPI0024820EA5|nr:PucR family transcriptional regulator [Streptomyces sp. Isolate_45]MDA5283236.1 helix-turn-helix domain-containing protein [Streptomyces sp. Isolate_45]
MCELLNRIWSRPRGEWTRVLRRELPALAAGIVEELREGVPGFAELVEDVGEEVVRRQVEAGLLTTLGYRESTATHHDRPVEGEKEGDGSIDQEPARAPAGADRGPLRPGSRSGPGSDSDSGSGCDGGAGHDPGRGSDREDQVTSHRRGRSAPLTVVPTSGPGPATERARRELFTALTGDMSMSDLALAELAAAANWPLPPAVRAIAMTTIGEVQQLAAALDDGLPGLAGAQPCLLVPSPEPEARTALEAVLRGRVAAVGHPVAVRDTASSLRWALRLLTLTPARAGLEARAVFVDDHLSTLLLLQDEPLAHALAARWLRPLASLTPRQSERLEVTLLAWLEGGGAPEAAKALSVHPQTVRYRMRQLEKLFGPGLRDPRTRFELELALRSRRLMAQVRRQHSRVGRRARAVATDFGPLGVGRMARVNGL